MEIPRPIAVWRRICFVFETSVGHFVPRVKHRMKKTSKTSKTPAPATKLTAPAPALKSTVEPKVKKPAAPAAVPAVVAKPTAIPGHDHRQDRHRLRQLPLRPRGQCGIDLEQGHPARLRFQRHVEDRPLRSRKARDLQIPPERPAVEQRGRLCRFARRHRDGHARVLTGAGILSGFMATRRTPS